MAGLDTQPSATTFELEELVEHAWQGRVRVPHFQRDFRWTSRDVVRLFDSIVRGYPVGSLLLWVRHSLAETVHLGRLTVEAPETDQALWVVDGQQRTVSLANALHPDGNRFEPFDVYYDLASKEFISAVKTPEPHQVPVPVLFDLNRLLDYFAEASEVDREYFQEARRVAKILRQFKIPAYLVRQEDEAVLKDIFDRMNNFGKRLSRAEIFSALFAGPESEADQRPGFGTIAEELASKTGFGLIDQDTVLHAILARRGHDTSREPRIEFDSARRTRSDFPDEDETTAYVEGQKALERTIEFLQKDAGVPHFSMVAYRSLLVVLSRFFAHFPEPEQRHRQLLARVYWRGAISGPTIFKSSFTQMSRALASRIVPGQETESIRQLIEALGKAEPMVPDVDRFRTNSASGKITLCSWWALGPKSPVSGERYELEELSNVLIDQSTPALATGRFYSRQVPGDRHNWAANRLLIPTVDEPITELPALFAERPPLGIDDREWVEVMRSHCISPVAANALASGNSEDFLDIRQVEVKEQLRRFLSHVTAWAYEDTPSISSMDMDDEVLRRLDSGALLQGSAVR